MHKSMILGIAMAASLMLASFAATTADAAFQASKAGKIVGKALNNQVFKTDNATAECTSAAPAGAVEAKPFTEMRLKIAYSGCSISGLGKATMSTAEVTFFDPKIEVETNNNVAIDASAPGVECSIFITGGAKLGGGAGELKYVNNAKGNLEVLSKITGIKWEILGSSSAALCGTVGENGANGTYTGNIELLIEGGGTLTG